MKSRFRSWIESSTKFKKMCLKKHQRNRKGTWQLSRTRPWMMSRKKENRASSTWFTYLFYWPRVGRIYKSIGKAGSRPYQAGTVDQLVPKRCVRLLSVSLLSTGLDGARRPWYVHQRPYVFFAISWLPNAQQIPRLIWSGAKERKLADVQAFSWARQVEECEIHHCGERPGRWGTKLLRVRKTTKLTQFVDTADKG